MIPIHIRNLSVTFNGAHACRNVDLDINAGKITLIIGRSGSGKTTLLRAINRLNEIFPDCRTSGGISLQLADGNLDVYAPSTDVEALRRRVGMVFQSPNVLPVSIARNLLMPLRLLTDITDDAARHRMEKALQQVGLWREVKERLDKPADILSGGQQQRLCLARALALEPDVLLLDEPTASVDYRSASIIEELLLELVNQLPLVIVSHSLRQTRALAGNIALMRDGKLAGTWRDDQPDADTSLEQMLADVF